MSVIPEQSLTKLKCSDCKNYLYVSPIILKNNGENICGKCASKIGEDISKIGIRNLAYEELAMLVLFPCCYESDGCEVKLPLDEIKHHEIYCDQRVYTCPMLHETCTWNGKYMDLRKHYADKHASLIITERGIFDINAETSFEKCFLLEILNFLFLIQVKCDAPTNKLWYCVRFLGNPNIAKLLEFVLEIGNETLSLKIKSSDINSSETFIISKEKSLEIDIKDLKRMLKNCTIDNIKSTIDINTKNRICLRCFQKRELKTNEFICKKCQLLVKCKFNAAGCNYEDVEINMPKHEYLFCQFGEPQCIISTCDKICSDINMMEHILRKHKNELSVCSGKNLYSIYQQLKTNVKYEGKKQFKGNTFILEFNYIKSTLTFKILSSLSKLETLKYKCEVKLKNPTNDFTVEHVLKYDFHSKDNDWLLEFKDDPEKSVFYNCVIDGKTYKCYDVELIIDKVIDI